MQCFQSGLLDQRHFSGKGTSPCMLGKRGREIFYHAIDPHLGTWRRQLRATAHWLSRHIDDRLQGNPHENLTALVFDSI
jgi:CRISPR-associated protein Cas1